MAEWDPRNITLLCSIPFTPPHYSTMSGRRQVLPPLPHVEAEMEEDTTKYQVEPFGAQSPW